MTKPRPGWPRFGIWALVHGSRGALADPEESFDASWERNRRLVLEAEALDYDSTLIAQHTANPYDDNWDELEALTSRIEIIAAIKPPLYHPVVLAKMAYRSSISPRAASRSTWSTPGTARIREGRYPVRRARCALCLWPRVADDRGAAVARRAGGP